MSRRGWRWGRAGALALAAAVGLGAATGPVLGAAPSRRVALEHQLSTTLNELQGTRERLGTLSAETTQALGTLNQVTSLVQTDSALAARREAEAQAAARAVARIRVALARRVATANTRRREVCAVLQGEEVASADPLGGLAPFLGGGSLSQAVSTQSEMAMVGSANAQALERAGRAVLAARREAQRLAAALVRARAAAAAAVAAQRTAASERSREASIVSALTRDRAAAAQAVQGLEAHAAGLRQAIAALLAAAASGRVSNGTLMALVAAVAQAFHVDSALVWAVVQVESSGNPHATSASGAQGLMQLEPGTAAELGVANAYNATQNLRGGTYYLASLIQRYHGNLALALAAYNMGPGNVPVNGPVPAAARGYVNSVLANWQAAQSHFSSKG